MGALPGKGICSAMKCEAGAAGENVKASTSLTHLHPFYNVHHLFLFASQGKARSCGPAGVTEEQLKASAELLGPGSEQQ